MSATLKNSALYLYQLHIARCNFGLMRTRYRYKNEDDLIEAWLRMALGGGVMYVVLYISRAIQYTNALVVLGVVSGYGSYRRWLRRKYK